MRVYSERYDDCRETFGIRVRTTRDLPLLASEIYEMHLLGRDVKVRSLTGRDPAAVSVSCENVNNLRHATRWGSGLNGPAERQAHPG